MPSDGQDNEFSAQNEVDGAEESVNPNDSKTVEQSGSADSLQLQTVKKRSSEILDDCDQSSQNSSEECSLSSNAEVENVREMKKICELDDAVDQPDNTSNLLHESNTVMMQIKEEIEDITSPHCEETERASSSVFIGPNGETVRIKEEPQEVPSEFVEPDGMVDIKQELEEDHFIEPENVIVKIEMGTEDPLNIVCGHDNIISFKEEAEDVPNSFDSSKDVIESEEDVLLGTASDSDDVDLRFTNDHDYEGRSRKSHGYVKVYTECTLKAMAFIANEQAAKAAGLKESVEPKKAKMNDLLVNLDGELRSTEYIKVYPDEYLRGIKPHLKFAKGNNTDPRPRVSDDIKLSILEEAKANFTRVEGPEMQEAKSHSRSMKRSDADLSPGVSDYTRSMIPSPEETEASFSCVEAQGAMSHSKFVKCNTDARPRVSDDIKLSILEETKASFLHVEAPEQRGVKPHLKFLKEGHVNLKRKVSDDVKLSILEEAKANFTRETPEAREAKLQSKSVKGNSADSKSKVSDTVKLSILEEARVNFSRVDTPESRGVKPHSKFVKVNNVDPRSRVSDDVKLSILEGAKANFSRVEAPEASKTQINDEGFLAIKSEMSDQVLSHPDEANLPEIKSEKNDLFLAVPSTSSQQPNATVGPSKVNLQPKRGRPQGSKEKLLLQKVENLSLKHGKLTHPLSVSPTRRRKLGFGLYDEQPLGQKGKKKVRSLEEVAKKMQIERTIAREQLAVLDEKLKKHPVVSAKTRKAKGLGNRPNKKLSKIEIQVRVKKNAAQAIEDAEKRYRMEHEIAVKQLASLNKDTTPTKPLPFSPLTPKARLGFGSVQEHLKPILFHKTGVKKRRLTVGEQLKETQERMDMERQLAEKQLASLSKGIMASAPAFSPLTPKARLKMGYVTLKPPLQPRIPSLGQINQPFRPICPPPAGGSRS